MPVVKKHLEGIVERQVNVSTSLYQAEQLMEKHKTDLTDGQLDELQMLAASIRQKFNSVRFFAFRFNYVHSE